MGGSKGSRVKVKIFESNIRVCFADDGQDLLKFPVSGDSEEVSLFPFQSKPDESEGQVRTLHHRYLCGMGTDESPEARQL